MSRGLWPPNMGCGADYCARDVSRLMSFDKSAHLFVELPVTKAIFSGVQADLSFTPQFSFADSSIFKAL